MLKVLISLQTAERSFLLLSSESHDPLYAALRPIIFQAIENLLTETSGQGVAQKPQSEDNRTPSDKLYI
jgi:hypothetical protein